VLDIGANCHGQSAPRPARGDLLSRELGPDWRVCVGCEWPL